MRDASIRCMRRTTVSASEDDYLVLEREAKRRGVPLGHVLREAVAEYAAEIRAVRKPRMGVVSLDRDLSQESVDEEEAPVRERARRRGWQPPPPAAPLPGAVP